MRFSFASILLVAGMFVALGDTGTVAQTPLPNFVATEFEAASPAAASLPSIDPFLPSNAPPSFAPSAAVVNYEMLAPADAVPPAIPESEADAAIKQLQKRLAEVEGQLKKRDDADKKAASASARKFAVRPFGRLHIDAATFDQDAANKAQVGNARNGVDIRRARLGCEGEGFDTFFYRFDVDFVVFDQQTNGRPVIFDMYLDVQNLPILGNVRVGHFREPFSLDRLNSSNDFALMERPAAINILAPFRNLGVMMFDWNEAQTMTWSYGVFDENTNEFGAEYHDRSGIAATGRVTYLPWYDEPAAGRYLWHVGASHSYRRIADQSRRFTSTPEIQLRTDNTTLRTPNFIDTGVIPLDHYNVVGLETAAVLGPLTLQAEYIGLFGEQTSGRGLYLRGGYVEASYYLTGENRNYVRKSGIFGAVEPFSNFFRVRSKDGGICGGSGAWEVAARYSNFNTNDRNVAGGQMQSVTLGLNWYYAVRCRVMLDYNHTFLDRNGLNGDANIVGTRFQYAF